MGACCGALDEHTQYINQRLALEDKDQSRTNKLLFLGPGGSGKSTIFKQLQWLHGGGFGTEDALCLKEHIYCQITSQMKEAIRHYLQSPNNANGNGQNQPKSIPTTQETETQTQPTQTQENKDNKIVTEADIPDTYDAQKLENMIAIVQNHGDLTLFTDALAEAVQYIWKHEIIIMNAFQNIDTAKNKVLDETSEYFWDEIDRIKAEDYVPNETDIINVRYRTTGVIEKKFEINSAKFHIFDVGGQKSERKKWINCFNEVKAVIFVVSLSCFNEMMYEDLTKNCMVDSLELFEEIINNKHFTDTHIILFLNKRDLFQKKITQIPISVCPAFGDFEQYKHQTTIHSNPNDYEQTTSYIKAKFDAQNKSSSEKRKQIYTHLTCAMDRKNIDSVFNDVKHIVITQNLFNEGLC